MSRVDTNTFLCCGIPWTTKARGRDSRPIPPCYSLSGEFLIIFFEEGSIDRDLKSYSKSPKHLSCEDIKLKDICG